MESDKLVEILKFLLGKCTVFFKFLTNARAPSLSGSLDHLINFGGKKLYPVYLTLTPGSVNFTFHRIQCNCPMILPTEPYYPEIIIVVGAEPEKYYPGKQAPNPYMKTITLVKDGAPAYELFFVDAEGKDFIEFTIDEGKKASWLQVSLKWRQSVV